MFFKIVVIVNFPIFTGKHLCWSLQAYNFIKKRLHRFFLKNLRKFKNKFFQRTTRVAVYVLAIVQRRAVVIYASFRSNHSPAGIYLLKANIRNARTSCEIYSNLTMKTPERRHWLRSGIFIVNVEHISHLF